MPLLSPSEIIKQSWNVFTKHRRIIGTYILLLFLPMLVLSLLGLLSIWLSAHLPALDMPDNIIIMMVFAASLVFSLWTTIAFAKTTKNLIDGLPAEPWLAVFKSTSPLIWPAIYTSALVTLIVFAGSLLLIIPGIIFAVWYIFAFYAIIFDSQKGMNALRFSKKLIVGRWWIILWRIIAPTVFFNVLALLAENLALLLLNLLVPNEAVQAVTYGIVSPLISAITAPLTLAALIIVYFNAKETPAVLAPATNNRLPPTPPDSGPKA